LFIEIGKRYRNHKEKDFDESASKGKIADLTAQIKLQDNEGEKTIYVSESLK
jgi:hypothetical protein